jgi:hypothetical protein
MELILLKTGWILRLPSKWDNLSPMDAGTAILYMPRIRRTGVSLNGGTPAHCQRSGTRLSIFSRDAA